MAKVKLQHRNPKTAECWNCHRKYDYYRELHDGILGRCNQCDSDQWIISPDAAKKKRKGAKK